MKVESLTSVVHTCYSAMCFAVLYIPVIYCRLNETVVMLITVRTS